MADFMVESKVPTPLLPLWQLMLAPDSRCQQRISWPLSIFRV
jgi:hypothetical protein